MGEVAEAHSPDAWAEVIIDELRNRPLPGVDSYYKDVFGTYIDHAQDQGDGLDRERLARYLNGTPKDAEQQDHEDAYWTRIQDDFADFLQQDYGFSEGYRADETADTDDITVERLYTPGAVAVDDALPPSVIDGAWLTSIVTAYRAADSDEVYVHHVAYLEEDDARTAVQHLLDQGETGTVERVFWKSIRRGYDAPMQGFAEELTAAGEMAVLDAVLAKAEDRYYRTEVEQIRDTVDR